jgi:hypothetical protein
MSTQNCESQLVEKARAFIEEVTRDFEKILQISSELQVLKEQTRHAAGSPIHKKKKSDKNTPLV